MSWIYTWCFFLSVIIRFYVMCASVFACVLLGGVALCGSRDIEAQDQLHTLIFRFYLPCFCRGLSKGSGF